MPRLPMSNQESMLSLTHQQMGERLAILRKAKGLTQKELAEMIGVTRTVVTDYECGRVRLYDEMIARLANVLECSADTILGLKPMPKRDSTPRIKIVRRMKELELLPETKQKVILKVLDDLIRANS